MITSFAELKGRKDNLEKLTEKLNQMSNAGYQNDDDRFWQPTVDKAGNGYAVIRFLPAPPGEEDNLVRIWDHGFQGPGGWYIENSLTTLNQPDPVAEMNTRLWNEGEGSAGRKFVSGGEKSGSKRRLTFTSNIYIVEDSAKPENNGTVRLYRYGKKIYDKISSAANPEYPDTAPFDPFDLWKGTNFKLKIRKVEGRRNYDSSEWDLVEDDNKIKQPRGPLLKDDEKLEALWKSEHSLQELIHPSKFKSFNELKAKLNRVMGETASQPSQAESTAPSTPPWEDSKPVGRVANPMTEAEVITEGEEEEDSLELFKKLTAS